MVRGKVIHTILPGVDGMKFPCIFAYGTRAENAGSPNVIEGNAVWDFGEAIQVVSDVIVRNNLVLNSEQALAIYRHVQVPVQRNVRTLNNSYYGSPLELRFGWARPTATRRIPPPKGIVIANNAIYGPGIVPLVSINMPRGGDVIIARNTLQHLGRAGAL